MSEEAGEYKVSQPAAAPAAKTQASELQCPFTYAELVRERDQLQQLTKHLQEQREVDFKNYEYYTTKNAKLQQRCEALEADEKRLNWLCDYITEHGSNGIEKINWSYLHLDDPMLETEFVFDRKSIDAAIAAEQEQKGQVT